MLSQSPILIPEVESLLRCSVVYFGHVLTFEIVHVSTISYSIVGKPVPPIRYIGFRANTQETAAMFVRVFHRCAADFQKLLRNVSSLDEKERQFSA